MKRGTRALTLDIDNKLLSKSKRSQVWVETVVYTLIAFVILGAILGFARPKIEKLQDESIIEQSIKMLEDIDGIIEEVKEVSGNKREIELGVKKGSLTIDSENDQIIFDIESRYTYSEPGILYEKGDVDIYNHKIGELNKINATISYKGKYDLLWSGEEKKELLTKSSASYKIFISNDGKKEGLTLINFEIV